jgi:hypothetical protein
VQAISTSNAALAEHTGFKYDRASGFPDYLKNASPGDRDDIVIATKYYDAVRFAARFEGPSFHNISFEDDVCPPATSWSAYNRLTGEKVLLRTRDLGHSHPWSEHQVARMHFFRRHFGMAPANPWKPDDISYGADAGSDQQISLNGTALLTATVDLEGVVNQSWPGQWKQVSGPGAVTFSTPSERSTGATFSAEGQYLLRFEAHDETAASSGLVYTVSDTVEIVVGEPSSDLFEDGFESASLSSWS